MAQRKPPRGHPAKQDPDVAALFRLMRSSVELVPRLQPRLTPEADVNLRAAALALMHVWAELSGMPTPEELLNQESE